MRAVPLVVVALAVLAGAAWVYRDDLPWLGEARSRLAPIIQHGADAVTPASDKPAASSGLRRCERNGTTLYTNEACPPGSRELGVSGGAVSVVPAFKAPPSAASDAASGIPTARDMLRPHTGDGEMRQKMIERATGG